MTINETLGKILKVAGIHLEKYCFSRWQLYVTSPYNLHVQKARKTKYVVHKKVLKLSNTAGGNIFLHFSLLLLLT